LTPEVSRRWHWDLRLIQVEKNSTIKNQCGGDNHAGLVAKVITTETGGVSRRMKLVAGLRPTLRYISTSCMAYNIQALPSFLAVQRHFPK
jgi:hypothetical protein